MPTDAARCDHSPAELAELERTTGLELYGYLHAPPVLVPILGAPGRTAEARRALVLRLARAGLPVAPDLPQVEAGQLAAAGDGSRRRAAGG